MPSFAFLNDDEIARIANYVRNMQEVKYTAVSPQNIAKARTSELSRCLSRAKMEGFICGDQPDCGGFDLKYVNSYIKSNI